MVCPYCNSDMTKGFLVSNRRIIWSQCKDHPTIIEGKSEVVPPGSTLLFGSNVPTFHCESCKKLIIECNSETE